MWDCIPFVGVTSHCGRREKNIGVNTLLFVSPGLWWRKRSYFSMQNEITSTNNKLKIETPGVYYIYSQVSYCANLAKPQTAPFVQSIHLKRSSEPEKILLKGVNTVVSSTENCALQSTQIGAVFTFKENDLLFVKVTDPACVNYSPEYTYFGTFKVGDTSWSIDHS